MKKTNDSAIYTPLNLKDKFNNNQTGGCNRQRKEEMIYTDKHLHLMCKNINTNFFLFKTSNGKIHLANDIVIFANDVYGLTYFITGIDEEHAKSYIIEMFKNSGHIDESNTYTDMRSSFDRINDLYTVVTNGKPIHMIADNDGFYGF